MAAILYLQRYLTEVLKRRREGRETGNRSLTKQGGSREEAERLRKGTADEISLLGKYSATNKNNRSIEGG